MNKTFVLEELPDDSLDAVLSLSTESKSKYFSMMVKNYYPKVKEDSNEFDDLVASYVSSFYVEKIYRSNLFFNEKFTPIYTQTGLIRNIVADMYYTDNELLVH